MAKKSCGVAYVINDLRMKVGCVADCLGINPKQPKKPKWASHRIPRNPLLKVLVPSLSGCLWCTSMCHACTLSSFSCFVNVCIEHLFYFYTHLIIILKYPYSKLGILALWCCSCYSWLIYTFRKKVGCVADCLGTFFHF